MHSFILNPNLVNCMLSAVRLVLGVGAPGSDQTGSLPPQSSQAYRDCKTETPFTTTYPRTPGTAQERGRSGDLGSQLTAYHPWWEEPWGGGHPGGQITHFSYLVMHNKHVATRYLSKLLELDKIMRFSCVWFFVVFWVFVLLFVCLLSTWHELGSSGKKEFQLRKWLCQIGL